MRHIFFNGAGRQSSSGCLGRLAFAAIATMVFLLTLCASVLGQETPGTVRFPAELDTQYSLFRVTDSPQTRLASSITSFSTTITVVAGGTNSFPDASSIKIDNEIIYYTSKTSTQFLGVTRGANGTTAAAHASGAAVRSPILSVHHNTLAAAIVAIETVLGKGSAPASAAATGDCRRKNPDGTVTWQSCGTGSGIADPGGANDDLLQRKAGSWTFRTPVQVKTDLALTKSDVSLGNVDNTSDATKNAAAASITNKTIDGDNNTLLDLPANTVFKAGTRVPIANLATGTPDGTKFIRDDGTLAVPGGGGSGANTALSNLASVAINTTLVSDTNNTDDLGTSSFRWRTLYLSDSLDLDGPGAGRFVLGEGAPPTVVAETLTFAAPADVPASGLIYILPSDTPANGEQMTASISGTTVTLSWEVPGSGTGLISLEGQTGPTQTFTDDANVTIVSGSNAHAITWVGTLAKSRQHAATIYNDQANAFSSGPQDFSAVTTFVGGMRRKRTATATNYTVLTTDGYVAITDTSATRTITLPDLGTADAGTEFTIADESNGAMVNPITIQAGGADTFIAGITGPVVIDVNNGSVTLLWTGTSATAGWRIK